MSSPHSLSLKLWLPSMVLTIFALSCITVIQMQRSDLESALVATTIESITRDLASLRHQMESEFSSGNAKGASRALSFRGLDPHYAILVATDDRRRIIHASRLDLKFNQAGVVLPVFDQERFSQVQRLHQPDIRYEPEFRRITAYYPLTLERRTGEMRSQRVGLLFLNYDLKYELAQIWGQVWHSTWPIGLGLLVLLGGLIFFLRHFVAFPIQHLIDTTSELDQDDGNRRSHIQGSGELARLGAAINDLADRLRDRKERRKRAEQATREQQQLVEDLLNSTAEAIFGLDTRGNCTFANPRCVQMLACRSVDELIGLDMPKLLHHRQADGSPYPIAQSPMVQAFRRGRASHIDSEIFCRCDGTSFPAEYRSHPICRDGVVIGAVVTFLDSTERQEAKQKILYQAHFDSLTGLPNRFLSLDRLEHLLEEAKRSHGSVAVLFLDLDDFKKINDSLGHEMGDKLLIEASKRLARCVRSGDTVGRLGGDEFIVLLHGLTMMEVRAVLDKLIKLFRMAFTIQGRELILSVSIGIAIHPGDGENASTLLRNADLAMYSAKTNGRNSYAFFTSAMNSEISRRFELEQQIHGALERGEFQVVYQPQVDIATGKVIGAEALLRWHNSALGPVSPDEFIPIAEQTGLIVAIGKFVMAEALAVTSVWRRQFDDQFRMAVNLSPCQLRQPDLVNYVEKILHQFQVPADKLELEITEGVLMSGSSYVKQALAELSDLGVSIAMDDFGTGYSSFSYLRSYPFNILKIDRSFIKDLTVTSSEKALVNAAIAMAHGLGLRVIAEGVETVEQYGELERLGCDYAQGYLLGRPVAAGEFWRARLEVGCEYSI